MTDVWLGFWCVYRRALHLEPIASELASVLTDERWPWKPAVVRPTQRPGQPTFAWPGGKIAASRLRQTVHEIICSKQTTGPCLVTSKKDALDFARYDVKNGQDDPLNEDARFPFRALALCRATDLPAGTSIASWIDLVHELAGLTEASHAVLWADTSMQIVASRAYLTGVPRPQDPPDHPFAEVDRVKQHRAGLGDRWIRPPAWGTYLKPAHVDALGGRARLVDVVRPAVVREVGELLYFQLSERVEDAVNAETEAKRRVFERLAEPITVPRTPAASSR